MGLDTCTFVTTVYDAPTVIRTFDVSKKVSRASLNGLLRLAGENDILDHRHNQMVYEVDITFIDKIQEQREEIGLDEGVIKSISFMFNEFKKNTSMEEVYMDPLAPRPKPKARNGVRFFLLFEG